MTSSSADITLRLIVGSLSLNVESMRKKSGVYFKALSKHFSGKLEESWKSGKDIRSRCQDMKPVLTEMLITISLVHFPLQDIWTLISSINMQPRICISHLHSRFNMKPLVTEMWIDAL
jgi:hypothetical protein